MNNEAQLVGIIFAGVGALGLVVWIFWSLAVKKFLSRAQKATGVITSLVPRRSSGTGATSVTYAPAVRFQTAAGQQVDFVSRVSTSRGGEVGGSVEVLYLVDNPQQAKINRFSSLWLGPLIFGLIGGVFAAVGVALWLLV